MKRIASLLTLVWMAGNVNAQGLDEIVVTGSRISTSSLYSDTVPVIHLTRRPDYMVVNTFIESDSRSRDLRLSEVRKTMASLAKVADKTPLIELGLLRKFEMGNDEIEYVVPFSADEVVPTNGYRADTTRVNLVIKSPIRDTDASPEVIYARIEEFIDKVPVTGRAVVSDSGDMSFSLVNIDQYREPLLKRLAEEAASLKAIFGDSFTVYFGGMEAPMRWRATGPMTLAIYFPYSASISEDD